MPRNTMRVAEILKPAGKTTKLPDPIPGFFIRTTYDGKGVVPKEAWDGFYSEPGTPVEEIAAAMLVTGFDPDSVAQLAGASVAKVAAERIVKSAAVPKGENVEPVGPGRDDTAELPANTQR